MTKIEKVREWKDYFELDQSKNNMFKLENLVPDWA